MRPALGHSARRSFQVLLFVGLLATLAACTPRGAGTRPLAMAWIGTATPTEDRAFLRFRAALDRLPPERRPGGALSYVHIRDLGRDEALDDLRRATAALPALWIAPTDISAWAAIHLQPPRPVVFASHPDPVLAGLVANLQRPGGQATGVAHGDDLHAKRLEVLRDAFPGLRTVAVLLDSGWLIHQDVHAQLLEPARRLGIDLRLTRVDEPSQVPAALRDPAVASADAWYVPPTYIAYRAEAVITAQLAALRKPPMHATEGEVARGALLAYALDTGFVYDVLADLVARVAAGEPAGQIPVQRPRRFVLSVRPRDDPPELRLPPALIRRADRVY